MPPSAEPGDEAVRLRIERLIPIVAFPFGMSIVSGVTDLLFFGGAVLHLLTGVVVSGFLCGLVLLVAAVVQIRRQRRGGREPDPRA